MTSYGVEIADMSKNGTWINDVRMAAGASRRLEDGDIISLGGTSIRLSCQHLAHPSEEEKGAE